MSWPRLEQQLRQMVRDSTVSAQAGREAAELLDWLEEDSGEAEARARSEVLALLGRLNVDSLSLADAKAWEDAALAAVEERLVAKQDVRETLKGLRARQIETSRCTMAEETPQPAAATSNCATAAMDKDVETTTSNSQATAASLEDVDVRPYGANERPDDESPHGDVSSSLVHRTEDSTSRTPVEQHHEPPRDDAPPREDPPRPQPVARAAELPTGLVRGTHEDTYVFDDHFGLPPELPWVTSMGIAFFVVMCGVTIAVAVSEPGYDKFYAAIPAALGVGALVATCVEVYRQPWPLVVRFVKGIARTVEVHTMYPCLVTTSRGSIDDFNPTLNGMEWVSCTVAGKEFVLYWGYDCHGQAQRWRAYIDSLRNEQPADAALVDMPIPP